MEEDMIVIRDPKLIFDFDWPKDVHKNLIDFIIKSNESLPENKIKNKIEQLLSRYKHQNYIHEHEKQQNE